jgi:nucleoside 2-deoxyribosyltransferase
VKVYFSAPLFTSAERAWNAAIKAGVQAAGHQVYMAQEQEPANDAAGIFARDLGGIDWADALVAIMDGSEPDSGTAWEVGYAYGKKPIVLVRTDLRVTEGDEGGYNPMLTQSASVRLDLPGASTAQVVGALLDAVERIQALQPPHG